MSRAKDKTSDINFLTERVRYLEEANRSYLAIIDMLASSGEFQATLNHQKSMEAMFMATAAQLTRLLPFKGMGFLECRNDGSFELTACDPASSREALLKDVDAVIRDGTFAWSLNRNQSIVVPSHCSDSTLILHVIATQSRIRGMFVGHLPHEETSIDSPSLNALTIILLTTAYAMESSSLYAILRKNLTNLEQEVEERTAELRNSEQRATDILNLLPDATFAIDLDGRIILWNRTAEEFTGARADDMLGKGNYEYALPFYGVRRPILIDMVLDPSSDISRLYPYVKCENGMVIGENTVRIPNRREAHVLGIAAPLYDSAGNITGAIESVRDITEMKQSEEERARLEDQLRQAQKMEAIGQFAGGIAHDFNNILTAIMGFASILHKKLPVDDPLAHYAEQVLASVERGAELTKSLLGFSRKQVLNPHLVNINDVVRRAAKFLQRIMGEDIKLETRFNDDNLTVNADPGQIEQVLMNLATNARDAMPQGGLFSIATDSIEIDADFVRSHGFGEPGGYIRITAGDTGYGMETDTASRVFEPFFTTKDIGKGTGLGLSIVYGIVKQHNGYIDVSSEPGKGTSFRIYLKRAQGDLPVAHQWEDIPLSIDAGETILLAEDDETIRNLVKSLLIDSGYNVIDAVDGKDAVRKYLENQEAIKLVLLDVIMPKKSGKKALDEIKAFRPEIKAVLISGFPEDGSNNDGPLTGGVPLLLKPVPPQLLLKTIRDVLDHGKEAT